MDKMRVVVMSAVHPDGLAMLRARPGIVVSSLNEIPESEHAAVLAAANVIFVRTQPIPSGIINAATGLKFIAKHGVGCDNIDLAAAAAKGVPVANTPGANANAVAEHTFALMLAASRKIVSGDRFVRGGGAPGWGEGTFGELGGKSLAIVGIGNIGLRVAELAQAFGMRAIAVSRASTDGAATACGCTVMALDDALAAADYLSLHVPLTEQTRGMIAARELGLMKSHAVLVSLARGGVIDEAALVTALEAGEIGGACLDVFEREPPAPEDLLMRAPNTIFSAHIGGMSSEATRQMAVQAAQNILDWMDGTLPNDAIVNPVPSVVSAG